MKRWIVVGAIAAGLVAGGVGVAAAAGQQDDDGTDRHITGDALDQASQAALDHIGSGRVTDTEVGDEDGYYEVEITKPDGNQIDVHLDKSFAIIGTKDDNRDDTDDR